jgi:hypothetical protein
MGTEFTGKYHWYSYFMRDLLSWMLFAAYADYLIDPSRWRKIVYTSLLLTASFSMLMTTEKGPFLWLLVGIFFVRIIIQNRAISDFFVIIRGGLVFIPLTVALFYIFMETDELSVVLNAFVSRLFVGQIQSFFHAVEIVPEEINYLYGLTFSNPGGILPYTPYDLSAEMAYRYGLQASMYEAAITTLPLMFSAEAYVNFGLIGLILTSLFVGYFFYWSNIKFNGLIARPLVVGAYVWAILHFKDLSMTGITMLIVDHQLWLTLIFLSLGMLFIGNYSSKKMIPHIN